MKIVWLALLLIIGKATGYSHGSSHQRPAPPNNYGNNINNFPPTPSPTTRTPRPISVTLSASPSNTLLVGAPVTLSCKFTAPINSQLVYFSIADNVDDPNDLAFDTSTIPPGKPMFITPSLAVVTYSSEVLLVFYKTTFTDSGVYQCYIPNVAKSNQLPITITDHLPSSASSYTKNCSKTTLIVSVTVPLAIVLAVLIALLVLRFRYGYRFYGFQFRRMPSTGADMGEVEKKAAVGKPDVLDPTKLPSYDNAVKGGSEHLYLPPGYDEAVYGKAADKGRDGSSVQVKPKPTSRPNVV